jgi:hypothetical protein
LHFLEVATTQLRKVQGAINLHVRSIVVDLKRQAEQRLRYYHYLLARAFEYRLLQPYPDSLVLPELHTHELVEAANKNADELSATQVRALMAPYHDQLSRITNLIIDEYFQRPRERQIPKLGETGRRVTLTSEECARLARGDKIEINLATRSEFAGLDEADRRLVGIEVLQLDGSGQGGAINIVVRHSGISAITWGGKTYGFRHLGYDGQAYLYWKSIVNVQSGEIKHEITHDRISDAATSLLLSQLRIPNDKFVLFADPGLDASLVIYGLPAGTVQRINKLVFAVDYAYRPLSS